MIRNAPFRLKDFESFQYSSGTGNQENCTYDSKTGAYTYIDRKNTLIKKNVKLRENDIIFLHGKAAQLGFWNFPKIIANPGTNLKTSTVLRYTIRFNYKEKSKEVTYMADFNGNKKLKDVAQQMRILIEKILSDAEDRYGSGTEK